MSVELLATILVDTLSHNLRVHTTLLTILVNSSTLMLHITHGFHLALGNTSHLRLRTAQKNELLTLVEVVTQKFPNKRERLTRPTHASADDADSRVLTIRVLHRQQVGAIVKV